MTFEPTLLFVWSEVLGYAAGSNSHLESTAPELLEELESALRPACLQVTFRPQILKELKNRCQSYSCSPGLPWAQSGPPLLCLCKPPPGGTDGHLAPRRSRVLWPREINLPLLAPRCRTLFTTFRQVQGEQCDCSLLPKLLQRGLLGGLPSRGRGFPCGERGCFGIGH